MWSFIIGYSGLKISLYASSQAGTMYAKVLEVTWVAPLHSTHCAGVFYMRSRKMHPTIQWKARYVRSVSNHDFVLFDEKGKTAYSYV